MDDLPAPLLPMFLLLARVGAFVMVLPLFGWRVLPMRIRAGLTVLLTIFFAQILPPVRIPDGPTHWLSASVWMAREIVCGAGIGLAVWLVFQAIEQGGRFAARQMGFAMAQVVNPVSGVQSQPIGMFFEITFFLFFLAMDGHHLLLSLMARSYEIFPVGAGVDVGLLLEGIVDAGSAMMLFMLQMAAPLLAGFLLLVVVLGVLARAMPEMNILMISFPVRIGIGFLLAGAMMPYLDGLIYQIAEWMVYTYNL